MNKMSLIALGLAAVLSIAGMAAAQPPPPGPPPGPPHMDGPPPPDGPLPPELQAESRELIQQVMITRLSRRLDLNDEQTVILMRRVAEVRDQQQELRRERMELMQGIRGLLREEKEEEALRRLMDRLADVNNRMVVMGQELRNAVDGLDLTIWQHAKLELFMVEFEGEMRRLVQDVRRGRPPMMGDGPDGPRPFRGPDGAWEGPGGRERGREDDMRPPRRQGKAGDMPRQRPDRPRGEKRDAPPE